MSSVTHDKDLTQEASGIGAKFAGGNAKEARDRSGLYATPVEATMALAKCYHAQLQSRRIWEPCAGNGAMSAVLHAATGSIVTSSDIAPAALGIAKLDMLATKRLPDVHAIITNPPFPLAEKIIAHVRDLHHTAPNVTFFALLLKSTYWHSARRKGLYESWRPYAIHPLRWRLDFFNQGSPVMEMMWCVWLQEPGNINATPLYIPLDKPESTK